MQALGEDSGNEGLSASPDHKPAFRAKPTLISIDEEGTEVMVSEWCGSLGSRQGTCANVCEKAVAVQTTTS